MSLLDGICNNLWSLLWSISVIVRVKKGEVFMARHGENIRKRKDGRWEARCICGYHENGKAKYKYIYRKTYAEAKAAKNQLISQKLTNESCDEKNIYVKADFNVLLTDWMNSIRMNVKESTYSRYTVIIDRHIRPELGNILVSDLTSEMIGQFTVKKLVQGNLKKSGGLSPKTVTGFVSVIRLALDYGVKKGYECPDHLIIQNPRQNVPKIQILTWEEQKKLESTLFEDNTNISLGIMTSLYLGLRIGEICALRWEDFDIENGILYVQKSIQRIPDLSYDPAAGNRGQKKTKIIIDAPKTSCSARKIPIPSFLIPFFKKYQADGGSFILTGSPDYMEPRRYYRKYKKIMKKCGLEHFNYHALRHTFATRCVENNFDIKSLSEILGHANVSTTLQKYVHPSISLKRQHMDRLENISICGQNCGHIS